MTNSSPRWSGDLLFTPGLMAFTGDIGDTAAHSHAAIQVLLVTQGQLTLTDAAGRTAIAQTAIIPPATVHEVRAEPGTAGLLAYLDPDSIAGRAAGGRLDGLPTNVVESWITAATPAPVGRCTHRSPPGTLNRIPHPAVAHAARLASDDPKGPPSLVEVAARVAISPSRLSHLFAAEMGLPYAAWRRWTRLRRAIDAVQSGASLTEAAHTAGFSDSAHLTRTCRDLFGITPTEALSATGWRCTPS